MAGMNEAGWSLLDFILLIFACLAYPMMIYIENAKVFYLWLFAGFVFSLVFSFSPAEFIWFLFVWYLIGVIWTFIRVKYEEIRVGWR